MIDTQNVQNAVSLLGLNQQSIPESTPPVSIQKIEKSSTERQSGISLLVAMDYTSLSGHEKNRDVLIRRVIQSKQEWYLDVVVMDKRMPRLIKVANIHKIQDITGGHIYTNPYAFIQNRLGIDIGKKEVSDALPLVEKYFHVIQKLIDMNYSDSYYKGYAYTVEKLDENRIHISIAYHY